MIIKDLFRKIFAIFFGIARTYLLYLPAFYILYSVECFIKLLILKQTNIYFNLVDIPKIKIADHTFDLGLIGVLAIVFAFIGIGKILLEQKGYHPMKITKKINKVAYALLVISTVVLLVYSFTPVVIDRKCYGQSCDDAFKNPIIIIVTGGLSVALYKLFAILEIVEKKIAGHD